MTTGQAAICRHCKARIYLEERGRWFTLSWGDDDICPRRESTGRYPDGKPHEPGPPATSEDSRR